MRVNAGFITPMSAVIRLVSTTNATAPPAPRRRSRANAITLLGLPPGSKPSSGANMRHTPVNASSNTSIGTFTVPRAGSFITAQLPLKPHKTTKWLKFQWMMHGNSPPVFRSSGSKR